MRGAIRAELTVTDGANAENGRAHSSVCSVSSVNTYNYYFSIYSSVYGSGGTTSEVVADNGPREPVCHLCPPNTCPDPTCPHSVHASTRQLRQTGETDPAGRGGADEGLEAASAPQNAAGGGGGCG